jgi:hypothetical protein
MHLAASYVINTRLEPAIYASPQGQPGPNGVYCIRPSSPGGFPEPDGGWAVSEWRLVRWSIAAS